MSTGKRSIVLSSKHIAEISDLPVADIDRDSVFCELFGKSREYTMTSKEVMYSLYEAVRYVCERNIEGDFVECGVWRGGSALLAALAFSHFSSSARFSWWRSTRHRIPQFWLYDTFEGMTKPTVGDVDLGGNSASDYLDKFADDGRWCYATLDDVRETFKRHGIRDDAVNFVKGDVEHTLRKRLPKKISILRLDTDWYESTKLELEILYPRLAKGGVLIIDDYGHWEGARRAVDEYFTKHPFLFLNRTSYAVRTAIKM